MSLIEAYLGGIHSFFSIWIFCLFQIIPFFIAFVIGAGVKGKTDSDSPDLIKRILTIGIAPFVGFIIFFTLMGMTTTPLSKSIFKHISLLNQIGGVIIGLISLYYIGLLTFNEKSTNLFVAVKWSFGFFLGAALAFAYRPCVTPTLSKIYMINNTADSAASGGILLMFYTLGASTMIFGVAYALALLTVRLSSLPLRLTILKTCGVILFIVSALILSNKMTVYKSFLVGWFVDGSAPGHQHNTEEKHEMMEHSQH